MVPHQLEVIVSTSAETFVTVFVLDEIPEARHLLAAVMTVLTGIAIFAGMAAAAMAAVALVAIVISALRGLSAA